GWVIFFAQAVFKLQNNIASRDRLICRLRLPKCRRAAPAPAAGRIAGDDTGRFADRPQFDRTRPERENRILGLAGCNRGGYKNLKNGKEKRSGSSHNETQQDMYLGILLPPN